MKKYTLFENKKITNRLNYECTFSVFRFEGLGLIIDNHIPDNNFDKKSMSFQFTFISFIFWITLYYKS